MALKIIIIDLETILLSNNRQILPTIKALVIKIQKAALKLILITKKDLLTTITIAKDLEIINYVSVIICFNGAIIYDLKHQKNLWNLHLNQDVTRYIYEIIKKYQLAAYAYGLNKNLYYNDYEIINQMQFVTNGYKLKIIKPLENLLESHLVVIDKEQVAQISLKKIIIALEVNQNLQLSHEIFNKRASLIVTPKNLSSIIAVNFLLNKWELTFKNCLFLGVTWNNRKPNYNKRLPNSIKKEYLDLLKIIKTVTKE